MPYVAEAWQNDVVGWKTHPVYKLNTYLREELFAAGLMIPGDYTKVAPFNPVQQDVDITTLPAGVPFIVYNFINPESTVNFFNQTGAVSYLIYCDDHPRGVAVANLMSTLLRKQDEAAQAVNNHPKVVSDTNNPFHFKWIRLNVSAAITPAEEEGGRRGYLVTATFGYTDDRLFA
jgi:hypothetical protein